MRGEGSREGEVVAGGGRERFARIVAVERGRTEDVGGGSWEREREGGRS